MGGGRKAMKISNLNNICVSGVVLLSLFLFLFIIISPPLYLYTCERYSTVGYACTQRRQEYSPNSRARFQ